MDVEERAKLQGWVPKEEFKGDPERWTSAEDYVERADHIVPIMKKQNKKYEEQLKKQGDDLASTKAEISNLKETLRKVVSINEKVSEREYNRAIETIKKEQEVAINEQDGAKFRQLENDKDNLIKNKPERVNIESPTQPAENPAWQAWVAKNDWYNDDPDLKNYSDYTATIVQRENPQLVGEEFYEAVKNRVKAAMPHKFENPNRQEASAVVGGDIQGKTEPKKKGYNSLPQEAKQACDNFVAEGLMTKEEYVKDYFEEE